MPRSLSPEMLYHRCDPELLEPAADREADATVVIGQQRATEAIRFGLQMAHEGYNIYVSGDYGSGRRRLINTLVADIAAENGPANDWCYVNNFDQPQQPRVLALPPGRGKALRKAMDDLLERLLDAAAAAFKGEEYRKRVADIQDAYHEQEEQTLSALAERARQDDVALIRTPGGYTLGPVKNGELLGPRQFEQLPEDERNQLQAAVEKYNEELRETLRRMPKLLEESRQQMRELNNEFARFTIEPLIDELRQQWEDLPAVLSYLDQVYSAVIDNFADFLQEEEGDSFGAKKSRLEHPSFQPYRVNLLVDNTGRKGPPIHHEDNPTYQNLLGRIEHVSVYGTLVTNFTLITAGALHRANGGYLVLDMRKLLSNPLAWEALKRVLASRALRIESFEDMAGFPSTVSLQPEPIPLDVKVVLYGPRELYYLLKRYDPEFDLLFKVHADFADRLQRDRENTRDYAQFIAASARERALLPLSRAAICATIEYSSRLAGDAAKASLQTATVVDLLQEADYWARGRGADEIDDQAVRAAVEARDRRQDQLRERLYEQIARGTILVSTRGEAVGQINGLAVLDLGDYRFGKPSRITATARFGSGKLVDIERETELGGPLHSKGVFILSAYIGQRFARRAPLSLSASLVFEQSYGMVEGDSASAAELCALLSAISGVPLKQQLAVTGSVNQYGHIQAIGGVNEKVEGFYDICQRTGTAPGQGVIIPASNQQHLMLRREVVEAVQQGRFAVYAVEHIDELLEIVTGLPAGEADADGRFPADSVNQRVQQQLAEFTELAKEMSGDKPG